MTELYIDNQPVALPEDFTFELIRENPFFTKGGSFTLDISLNLDIPCNAKLYGHLNRFNSSSVFKNRSARLIVDGRTVLNGTEIILEVNELSASIQLASGNSELNFLVGADVKMNTLDLGDIPAITSAEASNSRYNSYPEFNYVCAPVKAMNGTTPVFINNLYGAILYQYRSEPLKLITSHENYPEEIRAMPYLNYIIEKCITAIGYTINSNSIRNTQYNRLFIVHANNPKKYSDLMPDKTVSDFLSEVEELFDVMILVNENKSVDIVFRHEYYNSPTYFTPDLTSEQFERKYLNPDEEPLSHLSSNIRYDFPDTTLSKREDIDPVVRQSLKEVRQSSLTAINAYILLYNPAKKEELLKYIFIDESTGNEFILMKNGETESLLRQVNRFKRITQEAGGNDMEIEIVPADMEVLTVEVGQNISIYEYTGYLQLPLVTTYIGTSEEEINAEEAIDGKKQTSHELNKISVAFSPKLGPDNMIYVKPIGKEHEPDPTNIFQYKIYPIASTHYIMPWRTDRYLILDKSYATLSFKSDGYGLFDKIYSKGPKIDTSKEITIHSTLGKIIPNAMDIFLVEGKKCVCQSITFKITPEGFDQEYEAILYAML